VNNSARERHICVNPVSLEEMNEILKIFRNRKALDRGVLNMEISKYVSITAKLTFLDILNTSYATYQIPDDSKRR
jgi:hypothetical protein